MNQDIRTFLQKLLEDAGQTDMSPELTEQKIVDLNTRLEDKLILTAMDHLSEEKQDELAGLAENKAPAKEMEDFVKTNIDNWEEVFSNALDEFRSTYLGAQ